jgi:MFS family permease
METDVSRIGNDSAGSWDWRDPWRLFFWGWMADRIGRRKVFVATVLNFSLATGLMAASPDQYGWLFLAFCRMHVGIGVAGMVTVDLPLVQEFVPSSKRGWVGGLVTTTVSVGGALGATAGAYLGPSIGWRGLFLIGLLRQWSERSSRRSQTAHNRGAECRNRPPAPFHW